MQRILIVGAVVLLLVAVALFQLCSNLNSLVASTLETQGSALTGTRVTVGSVALDLRAGRGTLRNLRVGNPEGFSSKPAVALGEITLKLDLGSLTGSPIVVEELHASEPSVNFEVNEQGRANIDVIQRNVSRGGSSKAPPPADEPVEPVRLRIRSLAIEDGFVRADARELGGDEREIRLPSIRLSDVGGTRGGTPAEIGQRVLTALMAQIAQAVAASELQTYLERQIDENLGDLGEAAKGALRSILGTEKKPE